MRRIAVIGSGSCAGKTTLARRLAARLELPFIELDALFWGPNWTESDREEFRVRVAAALERDAWVVDGNYGSGGGVQWAHADTLVWLDIPHALTVWRVIARSVRRIVTGEQLWHGNRESLRNFLKRDSLLWYAMRTYGRRKRRFEDLARSGAWSHLTLLRFRSNADADRWLDSLHVDGVRENEEAGPCGPASALRRRGLG